MTRYAVVGLGVLGGATLLALARAGVECIGFDAGRVGHPHGASGGGETRIFRTAVADAPAYRLLLDRSRECWTDLDGSHATPARPVFRPCGALTVGPPGDPRVRAVAGSGRSAVLGPEAAGERWPAHRVAPDEVAVLDPGGGLLHAASATRALVAEARRLGAQVRERSPVLEVVRTGGRVIVRSGDGDDVLDGIVVATGHYRFPPGAGPGPDGVVNRRVVLTWFPVRDPDRFSSAAFPPGVRLGGSAFTFFPAVDGRAIKINVQVSQPRTAGPDDHHPPVRPDYPASWPEQPAARIDGLGACPVRQETYVEGYTPGGRGIVDLVGSAPPVVTLGGFSGQGFKYAPAVGELAADLLRTGVPASTAFAGVAATAG
ncbi:FAD-dependent oxidoreductase [Pseudonocardia nantongensis]|uniref:FAD-dependent oxidoreductase n=1 Tax=Pseudonocardia nantongensis TaxID=1181885 RepID=UPI003978E9A3